MGIIREGLEVCVSWDSWLHFTFSINMKNVLFKPREALRHGMPPGSPGRRHRHSAPPFSLLCLILRLASHLLSLPTPPLRVTMGWQLVATELSFLLLCIHKERDSLRLLLKGQGRPFPEISIIPLLPSYWLELARLSDY